MKFVAALGLCIWAVIHVPVQMWCVLATLVLFMLLFAGLAVAIYGVSRLRLGYRLPIELATLFGLLALSALIWRPYFYEEQERRCRTLAIRASASFTEDEQTRAALDREAEWFGRRASDLRWRGLRIGLLMGPRTRDQAIMSDRDLIYELGTVESVEKHEKRLDQLLESRSSTTN